LGPGVYLLNAFFSIESLLNQEPKFNKNILKNVKQRHQLCLIILSESGKLLKKTSLTETVIELFSTLRFSMHETWRISVSVTARQQTYCASNFEQGGGEVPSPSVSRKAKLWKDSIARNCWRNSGETLEMILA